MAFGIDDMEAIECGVQGIQGRRLTRRRAEKARRARIGREAIHLLGQSLEQLSKPYKLGVGASLLD